MNGKTVQAVTRRTEVAIAAETVAALLVGGLMKHDPLVLAGAARTLGVSIAEVRDAWRRVSDHGYRPPRRVEAEPHPTPSVRGGAAPRRSWKDEPAEKRCTKCRDVLPIEDFAWASGGRRMAQCKDCRRAYQQKRYLSVELQKELGHVLRFVAGEDDACVGSECPECAALIEPGQSVVVRSKAFEHATCLTKKGLLSHDPEASP